MSYTPTEWTNGDVITAEKLNKLEQGVAAEGNDGSIFIVEFEGELQSSNSADATTIPFTSLVANKTLQEIIEAIEDGKYIKGFLKSGNNGAAGFVELNSVYYTLNDTTMLQFYNTSARDLSTYATIDMYSIQYAAQGLSGSLQNLRIAKVID